ncbi:MAG TPA: ATP-binding protein [Methylomusa anaerophila]|uniref:AAA-like domain protein n=1 Tax=Methylomusa anaerophila TaxID=1930071 RepID=A0A348ANY9_9FIRM|nr:ATP-binding protein [Methylomusa anaerophila]BBB92787.1 AAA-like domain protein [Methylomusa anaerophila]HML87362.1 ATP-binding protein [Methylomusa anaerophila]
MAQQQYKGRLTYAQGTYVEFVVAPNQDVDFGDILVVEGKNNDRFYVRAYDFKVKSRWSGMNGVSYLMSKLDENGQIVNQEELDFYLGGNHTVKIGLAEQLCYADHNGQLFNPKTCPDFFCEVRGLSSKDTSLLKEMKGDLEIGFLKSGRTVLELPVGIFGSKAITEHIGIFGTTGSGKSNLVKVLSSSIIDNGNYGLLIFDVHNEYYRDLSQHPKFHDRLVVYNTNPESRHNVRKLALYCDEIEPEDITACATFTEPQLDAIYKLSSVWHDRWMECVLKYDTQDIIEELHECTGQKFQARTISKIKSICWNLEQELNISDTQPNEKASIAMQMMKELEEGKVVLVELKNISPVGEQALSTLLSKKLLQHYAGKTDSERSHLKPVLIVLEEAHRFLGKKELTSQNVFARFVSEARKFNLGLCVVDQQPRLLADKVLSQLNTLFILGLASKADRSKLEAMCRKDILQQRNEIKNLDCGELIVATNYMRFAAPVKVHKFDEFLTRKFQ